MQITAVHVYQHDLPVLGGGYRVAGTTVTSLDTTIVELITDTGLVGYGETCPLGTLYQPQHALGARAAIKELAPRLIGQDPRLIETVRQVMEQALNGARYAKAAVDIALWDLCGKAYGARVCDLLGGACRETVPSYYAIGVMAPDEAVRIATEKRREGFTRMQLKVGGRGLDEDIAAVRGVADALGSGVRLAVDANRSWTSRDALMVSLACRDLLFVMEQPCGTYEEILAVRRQIPHPIYLDESAEDLGVILRAIGDRATDGFGLKLTRVGGISAMRTIRDVCRAAGLPITCDDSWGGDIIAAACLHMGATVRPELSEGVWIAAPYIAAHYDTENGIEPKGGHLSLPRGPGLGVTPDTEKFGRPVMCFD